MPNHLNRVCPGTTLQLNQNKTLPMYQRRELAAGAETVEDLIAALGGPTLVAERLGITHPAVCEWKKYNSIPYPKLMLLIDTFKLRRRPLGKFIRQG